MCIPFGGRPKMPKPMAQPVQKPLPKPEEIKDNLWFHLDYEEIVHRIVKASSFKLNWILDPFMNVGAVGVVAKKRGRRFIGFENNQDQILLAMKTINEREK